MKKLLLSLVLINATSFLNAGHLDLMMTGVVKRTPSILRAAVAGLKKKEKKITNTLRTRNNLKDSLNTNKDLLLNRWGQDTLITSAVATTFFIHDIYNMFPLSLLPVSLPFLYSTAEYLNKNKEVNKFLCSLKIRIESDERQLQECRNNIKRLENRF